MSKNKQTFNLLRVIGDLASVIQSFIELYGKNIQHLKSTNFETTCEELGGIETKLDLIADKLNDIQIKLIKGES